jgi:hypothetical protein
MGCFDGSCVPVLYKTHGSQRLTAQYSETTAHCNENFDTDNQIYVA